MSVGNELTEFAYKFITQCSFNFNNNFHHQIRTIYERFNMVLDEETMSIDEKLIALHLVLSGQGGKTNGIIFVGPPGAGKSLFMSILASDFKRIGNFNVLNFKSEFALDDLAGADIAIGDEIVFENMNIATYFNLLLEGSSNLKLSLKNKSKVALNRIPVMIASNQYPWMYTSQVRPATLDRSILIECHEPIQLHWTSNIYNVDKVIFQAVKQSMFLAINKYF